MKAELATSAEGLPLLRVTLESEAERDFFGTDPSRVLSSVLGAVWVTYDDSGLVELDLIHEPDAENPYAAREKFKREAIELMKTRTRKG